MSYAIFRSLAVSCGTPVSSACVHPGTTLKIARTKAQELRELLGSGLDPRKEVARKKEQAVLDRDNTFGKLAEAWFALGYEEKVLEG